MLATFFTPQRLGFLSTATFGMVQFLVIALYPLIAHATSLSVGQVVLCFSAGSLLFLWSSPFWGGRSEKRGRTFTLSVGLFGLAASFVILVLLVTEHISHDWSLVVLLASRLLYGLTVSAIVSSVQAWWRDQSGDVTRNMLTHSMSLNLGRLLAPVLVILTSAHLSWLFWPLAIWCLLLALLALVAPRKKPSLSAAPARAELSLPMFFALATTAFLGLIHSTLAAHLMQVFSLTGKESAALMSRVLLLSALSVIVLQTVLRRWNEKLKTRMLTLGLWSWSIAAALLTLTQSYAGLWAAIFFLSIGIATLTPATLALLPHGGKTAGLMSASQTLGLALGGALGFLVLEAIAPLELLLLVLASFMWYCLGPMTRSSQGCASC